MRPRPPPRPPPQTRRAARCAAAPLLEPSPNKVTCSHHARPTTLAVRAASRAGPATAAKPRDPAAPRLDTPLPSTAPHAHCCGEADYRSLRTNNRLTQALRLRGSAPDAARTPGPPNSPAGALHRPEHAFTLPCAALRARDARDSSSILHQWRVQSIYHNIRIDAHALFKLFDPTQRGRAKVKSCEVLMKQLR